MSNLPYDNFRYRMLTAGVDWPAMAAKLVLTAWGGTPLYNPAHATVSALRTEINAGIIAGTGDQVEIAQSMPNGWAGVRSDGTAQTDNFVFIEIPVGTKLTWLTLAEMVPDAEGDLAPGSGSNRLLCFIDEAEYLPFYANGLRIVVTPDWFFGRGWLRP